MKWATVTIVSLVLFVGCLSLSEECSIPRGYVLWPGGFDPSKNMGKTILIKGILRVEDGASWVEATRVRVMEEEIIKIKEIMDDIDMYNTMVVTIEGGFLGWASDEAIAPHISRSDWAIKDETGAIYVSGMWPGRFDPVKDIGKKIRVRGLVKITKKGTVYIEASEIEVAGEIR